MNHHLVTHYQWKVVWLPKGDWRYTALPGVVVMKLILAPQFIANTTTCSAHCCWFQCWALVLAIESVIRSGGRDLCELHHISSRTWRFSSPDIPLSHVCTRGYLRLHVHDQFSLQKNFTHLNLRASANTPLWFLSRWSTNALMWLASPPKLHIPLCLQEDLYWWLYKPVNHTSQLTYKPLYIGVQ